MSKLIAVYPSAQDALEREMDAAYEYAHNLGVEVGYHGLTAPESLLMLFEWLPVGAHRWWPRASVASGERGFSRFVDQALSDGHDTGSAAQKIMGAMSS